MQQKNLTIPHTIDFFPSQQAREVMLLLRYLYLAVGRQGQKERPKFSSVIHFNQFPDIEAIRIIGEQKEAQHFLSWGGTLFLEQISIDVKWKDFIDCLYFSPNPEASSILGNFVELYPDGRVCKQYLEAFIEKIGKDKSNLPPGYLISFLMKMQEDGYEQNE